MKGEEELRADFNSPGSEKLLLGYKRGNYPLQNSDVGSFMSGSCSSLLERGVVEPLERGVVEPLERGVVEPLERGVVESSSRAHTA